MSNIVERLRAVDHMSVEDCFLLSPLFSKAADEIERLRAALREIEGMIPHGTPDYSHRVWTIARAALEGKG